MMSSTLRVPQSTKLLYLITPESYDLRHTPSVLLHSNLTLMISIHRLIESQYWKTALWANFLHNLLLRCSRSPPPPHVGLVYLPNKFRIKDWAPVASHSSLLPRGGELPTGGLHSALLLHKRKSWRAACAPGGVGPAPGQCYLCLGGDIGLIRSPIYLLI